MTAPPWRTSPCRGACPAVDHPAFAPPALDLAVTSAVGPAVRAAELAPRGVTVNIVAPAATDTPMLRDPALAGLPPHLPPLGRFVRPEDVAGAVAFLLGPDAGAITGQSLTICDGASL